MRDIHKAGLVHNDLKVPNLLLDPNGIIKIIDFGSTGDKGEIRSYFTAGHASPEALASLIEEQRLLSLETTSHDSKKSHLENLYDYEFNDISDIASYLSNGKLDSYYHHHLVKYYSYNKLAITILEQWVKKDEFKLGKIEKAQPSHDIWAFGKMVYEFLADHKPIDKEENKFIHKIANIVREEILFPIPGKRIGINEFIEKLDKLISSHNKELADRVNNKIEEHEKSYPLNIKQITPEKPKEEKQRAISPASAGGGSSQNLSKEKQETSVKQSSIEHPVKEVKGDLPSNKSISGQSDQLNFQSRPVPHQAKANLAFIMVLDSYKAMRFAEESTYRPFSIFGKLREAYTKEEKFKAVDKLLNFLKTGDQSDRLTPREYGALKEGRLYRDYIKHHENLFQESMILWTEPRLSNPSQ